MVIFSFLIVMNGWNWPLFVFVFLMQNVWHLSTWMIKSAQVVHLIKTLHKSWLSSSNAVTMAVSSANWNQCFGDKQSWYTYPMHSAFSDLTVSIKILTIRLKSNSDRLSSWRTPLWTFIGDVITLSVRIDILSSKYSDVISWIISAGTWWISSDWIKRLCFTSPKVFFKSNSVTTILHWCPININDMR